MLLKTIDKLIQNDAIGRYLCTGGWYHHVGRHRSMGYAGGNDIQGVSGCLSFITQNNINCLLGPPNTNPGYCLPLQISRNEFNTFWNYIKSISPLHGKKPKYEDAKILINYNHGYVNYIVMTQWRLLWSCPALVLITNNLYNRGYKWWEILALQAEARYALKIQVGGGANGIPFENRIYFPGTLKFFETIDKFPKNDVQAYYLNLKIQKALSPDDHAPTWDGRCDCKMCKDGNSFQIGHTGIFKRLTDFDNDVKIQQFLEPIR
jgi:hypothetical protein